MAGCANTVPELGPPINPFLLVLLLLGQTGNAELARLHERVVDRR